MLYYLLATLYVVACLLLLLVVLLQQGKGGDMASAFGGGGSQTAFGARAGATVLTRATTVLGVLFMLGAIVIGILGRQGGSSLMSGVAGPAPTTAPAAAPAAPARRRGIVNTGHDAGRPAARGADRRWPGTCCADDAAAGEEVSSIDARPSSRKWRNWQTHQLEGLAVAIP